MKLERCKNDAKLKKERDQRVEIESGMMQNWCKNKTKDAKLSKNEAKIRQKMRNWSKSEAIFEARETIRSKITASNDNSNKFC